MRSLVQSRLFEILFLPCPCFMVRTGDMGGGGGGAAALSVAYRAVVAAY